MVNLVGQPLVGAVRRVARGGRIIGRRIRVRGPSGLGDAIYMRPIVERLAANEARLELLTDYPQIFSGIPVSSIRRFNKAQVDIIAHYGDGRDRVDTTQYRDMVSRAAASSRGCIPYDLPFQTQWDTVNHDLIERIEKEADGRKIVLVHGGRVPMGRQGDARVEVLTPRYDFFDRVLRLADHCLLVRVGAGPEIYRLRCELDLWNRTTVGDLMDLAKACDGVIGTCSYAVPLAEIFRKPLLAVWSHQTVLSPHKFLRNITPQKILEYKDTSKFVMDDWDAKRTHEVVDGFLDF